MNLLESGNKNKEKLIGSDPIMISIGTFVVQILKVQWLYCEINSVYGVIKN
jgi:hypothetical protein